MPSTAFQRVEVDHTVRGGTQIYWTYRSTFTDPAPYMTTVEVGTTGNNVADDWKPIGVVVADRCMAIDATSRVHGLEPTAHYRVRLATTVGIYLSDPVSVFGRLKAQEWALAAEIVRKERLRMSIASATSGLLLKRRTREGGGVADPTSRVVNPLTGSLIAKQIVRPVVASPTIASPVIVRTNTGVYWPNDYFPNRYFGRQPASTTVNGVGAAGSGYWPNDYFANRYFGRQPLSAPVIGGSNVSGGYWPNDYFANRYFGRQPLPLAASLGTAILGGYYKPIPFSMDIDAAGISTKLDSERGTTDDAKAMFRCRAVLTPPLSLGDIFVASGSDMRYEILEVEVVTSIRSVPLVGNVVMRRLPFSDVAYTINPTLL